MRTYLIEDLLPADLHRLALSLKEKGFAGSLDGIYYLPIPEALLTEEQHEHAEECGPHIFALEALADEDTASLKLELLVRARGKIRCSCVAYATPAQREFIVDYLDAFIKEHDIAV